MHLPTRCVTSLPNLRRERLQASRLKSSRRFTLTSLKGFYTYLFERFFILTSLKGFYNCAGSIWQNFQNYLDNIALYSGKVTVTLSRRTQSCPTWRRQHRDREAQSTRPISGWDWDQGGAIYRSHKNYDMWWLVSLGRSYIRKWNTSTLLLFRAPDCPKL